MEHSFAGIMVKLRAGDHQAADVVFRRFVDRLVALAGRRIEGRYRAKADVEDVVQSAYQSFFRANFRQAGDSPIEILDWDGLWALLVTITLRKCNRQVEFWNAGKRDVRVERGQAAGPDDTWWGAVDREPTAHQALVLEETTEQLIGHLEPPQRKIAELMLQGYTAVEISSACECSERTVARVISRIRSWATRMVAEELREG